jgi:hypothetical protein
MRTGERFKSGPPKELSNSIKLPSALYQAEIVHFLGKAEAARAAKSLRANRIKFTPDASLPLDTPRRLMHK